LAISWPSARSAAIQEVIAGIDLYPLAKFDGNVKSQDYSKLPALRSPTDDGGTSNGIMAAGPETAYIDRVLGNY